MTQSAEAHQHGRNALVEQFTPLAARLASRYSHGVGIDEDLRQVAMLGLLEAANRFDPSKGNFAAFAIPTITGTLKKHLRSTAWAVHVPRRVQENALTVERSIDGLTQQLGRAPSVHDIAEQTGLSSEDIHTARRARQSRSGATIENHEPHTETPDELVDLRAAIETLTPAAKHLLDLRYEQDLTQHQIASELGISQPQVHRRLAHLAVALRSELDDDPPAFSNQTKGPDE